MNKNITSLFIVIVLFVVFVVVCESQSDGWDCNQGLAWQLPLQWSAGNRQSFTYVVKSCSRLQTIELIYPCTIQQPWKQCENDSQCNNGTLCGQEMYPRFCVLCSNIPNQPFFKEYNITVNNTQAMLNGQFWNVDDFYNHTGVDLILTLSKWTWSPNGKILIHDEVKQLRSTWGGIYNQDGFSSSTSVYLPYNETHIQEKYASIIRIVYDIGDFDVQGSQSVIYYPIPQTTTLPQKPNQAISVN